MKKQSDADLNQVKDLLRRGLQNLALERAEYLKRSNPKLGQEALLHVYAEVRDHLSFLDESDGIDPKELPTDLLDFFINSYIFVGNTKNLRELIDDLASSQTSISDTLAIVSTLEEIGDTDGALELLDKLPTEVKKGIHAKFLEGKILLSQKDYQSCVTKLEDVKSLSNELNRSPRLIELRRAISFHLARAYDKLDDYEAAWHAAKEGHEEEEDLPFDIGAFEEFCNRIIKFFTKKRLQSLNRSSRVAVEPLLVMGNPRSGTTLLDTILGMHNQVASGGELSIGAKIQNEVPKLLDSYSGFPDCLVDLRIPDANKLANDYAKSISRISMGRKYVTNKALNINLQLGLFYCITPGMKVISLHRHPLDNCISCYLNLVSVSGHNYNKRQEHQAKVWVLRRRLQDHWSEVAEEIPILQLHYESMVHNQEYETKRILKFFDLEFQGDCLNFHQSPSIAATVSKKQVQEPMYTTSAGRWKNYEPFIPTLVDKLGPWCPN